jgi:hypothetical protein
VRDEFGSGVFWGILAGVFIASTLAFCTASFTAVSRREVIDRGHAYYDPQTGEFTWRESTAAEPPEGGDVE